MYVTNRLWQLSLALLVGIYLFKTHTDPFLFLRKSQPHSIYMLDINFLFVCNLMKMINKQHSKVFLTVSQKQYNFHDIKNIIKRNCTLSTVLIHYWKPLQISSTPYQHPLHIYSKMVINPLALLQYLVVFSVFTYNKWVKCNTSEAHPDIHVEWMNIY